MAIGLDALERYQSILPPELFIRFRRERHQFRSVHQTSCTAMRLFFQHSWYFWLIVVVFAPLLAIKSSEIR